MVRAADAMEVGVGDPAEETCYNPDRRDVMDPLWTRQVTVNSVTVTLQAFDLRPRRKPQPHLGPSLLLNLDDTAIEPVGQIGVGPPESASLVITRAPAKLMDGNGTLARVSPGSNVAELFCPI